MIHSLIQLLFPNNGQSKYVNDMCLWIEQVLSTSRYATETIPGSGEYLDHSIKSLDLGFTLIPWDNILACIVLCVFIVCLFKFMRSIFTKQF